VTVTAHLSNASELWELPPKRKEKIKDILFDRALESQVTDSDTDLRDGRLLNYQWDLSCARTQQNKRRLVGLFSYYKLGVGAEARLLPKRRGRATLAGQAVVNNHKNTTEGCRVSKNSFDSRQRLLLCFEQRPQPQNNVRR
jgi:hypothetical protein